MGDMLVVTITADAYVNKGPSRPAFPERLRAEALAALSCVDAVCIHSDASAERAIEGIAPDYYVKGSEYEVAANDVTGKIDSERLAVEASGGQLAFTRGRTFSSSSLLNQYMPSLPQESREFLAAFRTRYDLAGIREWLQKIEGLRVLVVGETIIDEYQYCESIGKSSKAAALVGKAENLERFAGGAVAVANHVASFCPDVTLFSQVGALHDQEDFVRSQLRPGVQSHFVRRSDAPTIVKRRFVESYFLTSMFEMYEINDDPMQEVDEFAVMNGLRSLVPSVDLVLVVDYGHGMLSGNSVEVLCRESKFLAMNAQANAGNRGYHRISKYPHADYVCVARNEMQLESHAWRGDLRSVIESVAVRLEAGTVVVTQGDQGALAYRGGEFVDVPAFAARVVDRVGAGDAFLALTAPLVRAGAPADLVGFLGNVAGAEAVATVGHRSYLELDRLLKHVQVLLA